MANQAVKESLLASPAQNQWQKIAIGHHHGVVIPLFSLHTKNSCGIGEFPDLIPIIQWCRNAGFDVVQLLPLNDTGYETSPYSALSAFALNPFHVGLSHLPYLEKDPALAKRITDLQQQTLETQRVDYRAIQAKREDFLRIYYQNYGSIFEDQKNYLDFRKAQDYWLHDYAVFKALKVILDWKSWEEWPLEYRYTTLNIPKEVEEEAQFHIFIQFLCFQQFEQVKKVADDEDVKLKGDIPILINRESADVWRRPEQFSLEFAAGAPPDLYSSEGQKWGFPLYRWDVHQADNYRWWIERLRTASNLYHIYRIDHIVGFFRIWTIPLDHPAKMGRFTPENESQWIPQGEQIMKIMLENCPMLPIGEDLGIVPIEVRECLKQLGICGTKVMRWERDWHGDQSFTDPKLYPAESMTTVSTHDSDTLKLWWRNFPHEAEFYAKSQGWHYHPELSNAQQFAILLHSHRSGSLFHINLLQEYLAMVPKMTWPNPEDERINFPGIISDRNWSYRFRPSVEEIAGNEKLKSMVRKFTDCSNGS